MCVIYCNNLYNVVFQADAAEVYSNLASAAESGWDFSSRWFGQQGTLSSIRTKQIVPVDLNSIMCLNERLLADFYEQAGMKINAPIVPVDFFLYIEIANVKKMYKKIKDSLF